MITDLESAIKHCEEVAEKQESNAKSYPRPQKNVKGSGRKYNACIECAAEHRQLAVWLRKLKAYEEAREEIGCLPIPWKEDVGVRKCIGILDKHLIEVGADDIQL